MPPAKRGNAPRAGFCIFENGDGSGLRAAFAEGTDDLGDPKVFGGRMNDKTSAIWNRSDKPWCVYEHKNIGGHRWMISRGFQDDISTYRSRDGFSWENVTSSVRPAMYVRPPRNPNAAYWTC
ncbi:peptidase inhibitor family I36 protein [Nonomuraea typhae]|uniref:Peptidase inhibitor family I36 protein n=1 Tax=Nonomuraea typhae TaxID=2603600 RepID=A0ABW7YZL8_9ACTN